jgi:hydrogenase small subunit
MLNLNVGSEYVDTLGLGHQLQAVHLDGKTTIDDVLIDIIDLKVQQTAMSAAGELAVFAMEQAAPAVLVVEGSVPVNSNKYCTIGTARNAHFGGSAGDEIYVGDAIKHFVNSHSPAAILSVGTCASFGGIPGAYTDPNKNSTGALGVRDYLTTYNSGTGANSVINLPGCPLQPDRVFLTVASIICDVVAGVGPTAVRNIWKTRDSYRRPTAFYGYPIHVQCERQADWNASQFASKPGDAGCMMNLGCKGYSTYADCPTRGWNRYSLTTGSGTDDSVQSTSWPVHANHPCMGCTERTYPDHKYNEGFVKYSW